MGYLHEGHLQLLRAGRARADVLIFTLFVNPSQFGPREDFAAWFDAFLPGAVHARPATLFEPATVSDRSDGKIAHLDGLNLSRVWCWRAIAHALAPHPVQAPIDATIARHLAASLPHVAGDYMGEHWLASFALLALAGD